jgi:hypothetical protein
MWEIFEKIIYLLMGFAGIIQMGIALFSGSDIKFILGMVMVLSSRYFSDHI